MGSHSSRLLCRSPSIKMRIEYLADHIHVIPELAAFHLEFFGRFNPDMTIESRTGQLRSRVGKESIPLTLVAFEQDKPIGSACIVEHDMDNHPELTPWAASIIVRSDYRRRGVGTALMKRIEVEALKLGIEKLYLFTPDMEAFYLKLDWQVIRREIYRGKEVILMEKELTA
ncbi:MAG: GNAT family N-acetyltransferase [Anaerolineales bacterium]|nr:GNAT family N-acetyltransferase [Anaerolineales bacterium]